MWVAALVLKRKKWWWLPGKITGNHFSEVLCHHWDVIIIVIWDLKASSTLSKSLHFKVKRNFSLLISPSNLTFWRQKSKVFWYPKNIHSRDNIAFRSSRSAIKNSIDLLFTISFRESCFLWTIVLQSWLMQVAPKNERKQICTEEQQAKQFMFTAVLMLVYPKTEMNIDDLPLQVFPGFIFQITTLPEISIIIQAASLILAMIYWLIRKLLRLNHKAILGGT